MVQAVESYMAFFPGKIAIMWNKLVILLSFAVAGSSAGCAQYEFDVSPEGSSAAVHVAGPDDAHLADDPLQYRMRIIEGHLVMWIDNPTDSPIELLGLKSIVTDPDGMDHPIHGQVIGPHASIRKVLPPLESEEEQGGPRPAPVVNPYDQPGFIAVPGADLANSSGADSKENQYSWDWDDGSEIRVHLVFTRAGQQFEQRLTIRRVKK
jgi:hypothetical protein